MSNRKIILNAIGPEDNFLTGNPSTTYLKSNHQNHTNFAKNIIKICPTSVQNITNYNFGETVHFEIDKSADLLLNITLEVTIKGKDWINNNLVVPQTIYSLIEYIEILADTKVLQKLTGEWIYIFDQLYSRNNSDNNIFESGYASDNNNIDESKHKLFLKIPFWFCLHPGLSLPLWAIQHERIHIRLKLNEKSNICLEPHNRDIIIESIELISEIVDLDKLEKEKFQNDQLEYLIEQVEFCGSNLIESNFNSRKKIEIERYPYITEILWIFSGKDLKNNNNSNNFNPNNYFNYWYNFNGNPLSRIDHTKNTTILLNGNAINSRLKGSYYRKIPRYESHNTISCKDKNGKEIISPDYYSHNCIYSYSFSFNPKNIKPSGFLSTNKFNSMHLDIELNSANYDRKLNIYIKRFNIIRIKNGYINLVNT